MSIPGALVLLFLVAAIVSIIARRLRIPYTVALVVAGLALGSAHALPALGLSRDVMFGLVLPGLVFEAAFDLQYEEIRRDAVTLVSLAVPGVIATIAIVALGLPGIVRLFGESPSA